MFLLGLQFLVTRRADFAHFEPHSPYLYYVAPHQALALDVLLGVVRLFDDFPKHALGVFEQVFLLDEVQGFGLLI